MTMIQKLLVTSCAVLVVACGSKDKKEIIEPPTGTSDRGEARDTKAPVSDTSTPTPPELQNTVFFEFDSSDLSGEARAKLEENGKWMEEDKVRTLQIEGHTDEVGTADYNLGLGDRRARAAKDYLVRLGIDAARITIITYGEERPASDADSENRRSVFVATKK